MRFLGLLALPSFLLCSNPALSDELITRNWLNSREDWYLIEDSVKKTKTEGIYLAENYLSMYRPNDKLEIFDGDSNVIGYDYIGTYHSYGYVTAFDCLEGVTVNLAVRYYSGKTPRESNVVWEERFEVDGSDFGFPLNEDLLIRVCELAATLD